ncbi:MAG: caspase family protein [Cyanobacteria bacterium P01_A01_bin.40]
MRPNRRTFLQQAALALFSWGATETGLSALADNEHLAASIKNYQSILAEPTKRKLALLVGINRYPHHEDLAGCLIDIELQRELLIHRFGFNPQDILTLSDRQATRENIETAFIEHLTAQAQPDDVVVFHFSGYGNQIKMPLVSDTEAAKSATEEVNAYRLANSFVPVDGLSSAQKNLFANSILQETLLVLAQSLSTARCTFVLDTCFNNTPRSKHGSFKVRSVPLAAENLAAEELDFLSQLRDNLAVKGLKPSKRISFLPGVVLSATGNNQVAVERQWDGLSAGLFTQALTQHLWHLTPSSKVQVALNRTAETVEQVMGRQQQPTLNNSDKSAIAYYLNMSDVSSAVGIVSKVNKNMVEVKLLGFPINVLAGYGTGSCLSLVTSGDGCPPQLQIKSKGGLISKTQILPSSNAEPKVGQLIRESIRILARNLSLNLALDDDLQRIERVDATSALASISTLSSTIVAKEHNADCLLGKVAPSAASTVSRLETEPPAFSYGLYTAGGNLIGQTISLEEEAVKIAIDRLQPQFNHLLAAKWLKLTLNDFSSQLKVRATLTAGKQKQTVSWQRKTFLANNQPESFKKTTSSPVNLSPESNNHLPVIIKGSEFKLALANSGERQLYAVILGTDCDSNMYALYTPAQSTGAEGDPPLTDIGIASGEEVMIPTTESSWQWKVPEFIGINALYVVMATQPFQETLKACASQQNFKLNQQQVLNVTNPVALITALMQDLHNASAVLNGLLPSDDVYALNVDSWATLNFVYEVTNS